MAQNDEHLELAFTKLGHFWLDSGLVGLIKLLEDDLPPDVQMSIAENRLILKGSPINIQSALERAYDKLILNYYDLSTKKQESDISSYNFYYDTREDRFIPFPKKKAMGIASIIFNKAPRPVGGILKWKDGKRKKEVIIDGKRVKKTRAKLPDSHKDLQKRMDDFLNKYGLEITTSGLLIDGPNQIRPKVKIEVKRGKNKGCCYLCGQPSYSLEEVKETVFPFITGSSGVLSFNPQAGKPEKVCWKCSLLGKFVPVNGFYLTQGDYLFAFLPYSPSLEKMLEVFDPLRDAEIKDPNLLKNFDHPLGGYFQRPFEVTFAFLYTLYQKVCVHKVATEGKEKNVLDWGKMLEITISKAPLEFFVLDFESKGQTYACKMAWPFRDSVYFFRLMHEAEQRGLYVKQVMHLLIDRTQKKNENKTLTRNKICEHILKKLSILSLVERHVFHANLDYFKPLLDFLIFYENLVEGEGKMTKEEQETAVTLGKRIGMAVAEGGKKGDLYALRKARTKVDFLEQLNRLQFKLGNDFVVPAQVYEGNLTDENFTEFKQFCMVSALNSFNAAMSNKNKKGDQS